MTTTVSCLIVCVVWLAACAPTAPVDLRAPLPTAASIDIPNATLVFYDVSGANEQELRTQMSARGPNGFDAYTRWYVRWNWPGIGTTTCRLGEADVTLEISVTLPRWSPPAGSTPELVARWNRHLQALGAHEKVHVEIVTTHVPLVKTAIKNATCLTAEQAAQAVLATMRQLEQQYDLNTNHGATQGVRFP